MDRCKKPLTGITRRVNLNDNLGVNNVGTKPKITDASECLNHTPDRDEV
jgi:hypothetical protein